MARYFSSLLLFPFFLSLLLILLLLVAVYLRRLFEIASKIPRWLSRFKGL